MTIRDFLDLFVDDSLVQITVYDMSEADNIHTCYGDELPEELEDEEIESIDTPTEVGCLTINIEGDTSDDTVRIRHKLAARKKATELAEWFEGHMKPIGELGYGFETDEATMREAAKELGLNVDCDDGPGNTFTATLDYPDAGDSGYIFATKGGFQHINTCIIGVAFSCL